MEARRVRGDPDTPGHSTGPGRSCARAATAAPPGASRHAPDHHPAAFSSLRAGRSAPEACSSPGAVLARAGASAPVRSGDDFLSASPSRSYPAGRTRGGPSQAPPGHPVEILRDEVLPTLSPTGP